MLAILGRYSEKLASATESIAIMAKVKANSHGHKRGHRESVLPVSVGDLLYMGQL
jgi:hypothetical protein